MTYKNIYIHNARVNNLKNVSVEILRNRLVVITGVSGSGKSSLAYDTLYAEGQRRYVESLNTYARQFLARMDKPDVDYIHGISPAMAIQQKTGSNNPRSTVGTQTEIYDYLKILFARIGKTYSPLSGKLVTSDSISDIVDAVIGQPDETVVSIVAPVSVRSKGFKAELALALQKGFTRIWNAGKILDIEDLMEEKKLKEESDFYLLIDRIVLEAGDRDNQKPRLADSIQTAYFEGHSRCGIQYNKGELTLFSEQFSADNMVFERPSPDFFSFNNPYGACPTCEGFGRVMGVDEDLVIPEKNKSVYEGAVAPWRGEVMGEYLSDFVKASAEYDFPIHRPYYALSEKEKDFLWNGNQKVFGIRPFFKYLETQHHKIQYRVMSARYRGFTVCYDCKGSRIRKDAQYVKIGGYSIADLLAMPLERLLPVIQSLELSDNDRIIAKRILTEVEGRINYLHKVGVGYLTLNRKVSTLSGGEMQRIRLATSLGNGLVGAMYILDEPSIGLHPRDTDKLISILLQLRDKGNTVIVVEHDEGVMQNANQIIDMGPFAGELGGEVVFNGDYEAVLKDENSLTGKYLSHRLTIPLPDFRRPKRNFIEIKDAFLNNLKNISVTIPLNALTLVTGVSGSGKTTLIQDILYHALRKTLKLPYEKSGDSASISGYLNGISGIEMVDQSPVSRSSRSNPVTYLKAYDHIRDLFASQRMSKIKGLTSGSFSFNVEGGRCEECKGDGKIVVEMQFLPDVELLCEACNGKRFKQNVLDVTWNEKNIFEVLSLTVHEALSFFADQPKILEKLVLLNKVGLGYVRLGQSTDTFSGGEAQRMKLAFFLSQKSSTGFFYIFDEPTTGLHFDDILKLLYAIQELIDKGNTVVVIEHHPDVIKCADWIIDLGPEGGEEGGNLVYQGEPEGILAVAESYTGKYLKDKLSVVR
ncbi:MAG: excinuclease ABC subunit UvrA [Bacteroidia bacterium]|nr:excinuclease ABC subunit UvrA [Bacteroidia bacterium]